MKIFLIQEWFEESIYSFETVPFNEGSIIYLNNMINFFIDKNKFNRNNLSYIFSKISIYSSLKIRYAIIDLIIKRNDPEIIDIAATAFSNLINKDYFICLISELKARNLNYENFILLFISNHLYSDVIGTNNFLKAINKDYIFLIENLLKRKNWLLLSECINFSNLNWNEVSIISQLIGNYVFDLNQLDYFNLITVIFNKTNKSNCFSCYNFYYLLSNNSIRLNFINFCLSQNFYINITLISSFSNFLKNYSSAEYFLFEDTILNSLTANDLNNYSKQAPFCSKRKFLEKLSSFKEKGPLIDFVKCNSEFKKLLPML